MKKIHFSTTIQSSPEKVWQTLWNIDSYRQWASVFSPDSTVQTDNWKEGSKVLFHDGSGNGMVSTVAANKPNQFMSFKHLGMVKEGVEDTASDEVKGWAGAHENYTLTSSNGTTKLSVDMDITDEFEGYFEKTFPKALAEVKRIAEGRQKEKITPFLWFDTQAEEAANFYVSIFKNSQVTGIERYPEGSPAPAGSVMLVSFSLDGQEFTAMNAGPHFKFNPSISFFVTCETEEETDAMWQKLLEGGMVMIPIEKQPWSQKYGWVQDKFGLSWQISWGKLTDTDGQKFVPTLLFTGKQMGRAEEAVKLYTSIFKDSSIKGIMRYEAGEEGKEGTVKHAQATLNGQTFMFMDNPMPQDFTFNEAISFVVHCDNQKEVDYFWEKLITGGGNESDCGWLKDPFGVSWQITPRILLQLMSHPDPATRQRVFGAMMKMRKIDIETLKKAAEGDSKKVVTVETMVNAPIEKVWQYWTQPEHIMQWNNANDDWHTPRAENDVRPGGKFNIRMEAKDGSFGFDFAGVYDQVEEKKRIEYTMGDGRKVVVSFSEVEGGTHVIESFDAESENPVEMQRAGWQAILDNFKRHVEG